MAPLGVDKTILSPPKRSLSPTRGDSSLSQLFLFIFVDVCIVYVMFLAFGGRQNVFFITLTLYRLAQLILQHCSCESEQNAAFGGRQNHFVSPQMQPESNTR